MLIQVFGTGCSKCTMLEQEVKKAVEKFGLSAEVQKVEDIDVMMDMGIMITPALAVDGVVKSAGKVLREDDIIKLIQDIK